jgi:hypothetical protein
MKPPSPKTTIITGEVYDKCEAGCTQAGYRFSGYVPHVPEKMCVNVFGWDCYISTLGFDHGKFDCLCWKFGPVINNYEE